MGKVFQVKPVKDPINFNSPPVCDCCNQGTA